MPLIHFNPHPMAGKTIQLKNGTEYQVEDYWDRVAGGSWMAAAGNPAVLSYTIRSAMEKLPLDDEVLYGKVLGMGHLVHVSELAEVPF